MKQCWICLAQFANDRRYRSDETIDSAVIKTPFRFDRRDAHGLRQIAKD